MWARSFPLGCLLCASQVAAGARAEPAEGRGWERGAACASGGLWESCGYTGACALDVGLWTDGWPQPRGGAGSRL